MKKLLHERLIPDECGVCELECDGRVITLSKYDVRALRKEIERYYIPLSCDSDGNPWKIGDDCITAEGEEATIVGYMGKGRVFIDLHDERCYARCYASDLKRPQPKVLDADSVEIKEGENVWDIVTGEQFRVQELSNEEPYAFLSDIRGYCIPCYALNRLTHKEPDSLEKLRDDIAAWNELKMKTFCDEWIDRLSALIEKVG